jgi:hypothetical protein
MPKAPLALLLKIGGGVSGRRHERHRQLIPRWVPCHSTASGSKGAASARWHHLGSEGGMASTIFVGVEANVGRRQPSRRHRLIVHCGEGGDRSGWEERKLSSKFNIQQM